MGYQNYKTVKIRLIENAIDAILGAFEWDKSLEGQEYWQDVHLKLKEQLAHEHNKEVADND